MHKNIKRGQQFAGANKYHSLKIEGNQIDTGKDRVKIAKGDIKQKFSDRGS